MKKSQPIINFFSKKNIKKYQKIARKKLAFFGFPQRYITIKNKINQSIYILNGHKKSLMIYSHDFKVKINQQEKKYQKQISKYKKYWVFYFVQLAQLNLKFQDYLKEKKNQFPKIFKNQNRLFRHYWLRWQRNKKKFFKKINHRLKTITIKIKKKQGVIYQNIKKKPLLYSIVHNLAQHPKQVFFSITASIIIISGSFFIYYWVFKDLPSPQELSKKEQTVTTRILDRNGELLFRIYEDENRTIVPLSKVSPDIINATVAIEDQDFYHHFGFSLKGITRAFKANIDGEAIQGGSTITQQLVKNRLLSTERTLQRKIKELVLAVLVEGNYSKEEILEMYLNQVPYGGSTYGIEEAAWSYFNKSAQNLSLAESALLAGLPAAPSIYSPFGPNPELAYTRQAEVLRRMVEDGYITQEAADAAKQEKLVFRQNIIDIKAPHFVMYVKKLLAEMYGEDVLNSGGLEVRTTLDLDLQDQVQSIVTNEVNQLAKLRVNNGAALVTNPQTGEILAMVGSKDYFDFEHDGQVNVTLRPRQPGSSIKGLTYAIALDEGQTPTTMIDDSPITYNIPGSPPYSPKNYDGKYHGRVTLREALASSYNIPAVKTLAGIGVNKMIDKAEAVGITTWADRRRFGLSLTLGGGEILMLDMAKLYGTFANMGYTVNPDPFLEIKNSKGEVLYRNTCVLDHQCSRKQNFKALTAYQITDILADNQARTPAFGARSVLYIPNQQVAVKTGTTNNLRDNWTIGYTTDRLVAVWVGNNDNQPMSYVASGITGASPIWNHIFLLLLDEHNPHQFSTPDNLIKVKVCAQTGTLPCKGCPTIKEEVYIKGTEPKVACDPAKFRIKPTPYPGQENRDQILEGVTIEFE